ncbi:conserved hypothetical protein [Histoplasma capsulatum var. duboisii H88]|uniref:Hsp70-like protein n=1 Tax=Ajellomyces capsulatus (strain H88) TaxID=544711 RepID=F0UJ41_AJEC8|nr:conserved hypothetical protein [Histoplasma capsulatum var. duboisii H88]
MAPILQFGLNGEVDDEESELGSPTKKSKDSTATAYLIVGIDFGTTYSGVAVGHSENPETIYVISNWPGNVETRNKVSSIIADKSDQSEFRPWGYEVSSSMDCSSWFKLHMAPKNTSSIQDDPLLSQSVGPSLLRIPEGESPGILCKEYLQRVYKHVMGRLRTIYGRTIVETVPIKVVLTTPADWDRKYKTTLREAAYQAGIASRPSDSILTIDEPEAAALAAFKDPQGQKTNSIFKVNNNVVVVDIGGGTIDIITYEIIQRNPLKVAEACTGTSAKCGATTIDRELHRLMASRYGAAFSDLPFKETGHGSLFMTDFEAAKKCFIGHGSEHRKDWELGLIMDIDDDGVMHGNESGTIKITSEELAQMFEKVITRAFEMVLEQIKLTEAKNDYPVNLIILCGGMAESPYVQTRFNEFCEQKLDNKVDVIVPQEAWPAIAKGAVIHALRPPIVESRKSRWSYGIGVHRAFDPKRDNEKDQYNCPSRGQRTKGQVEWFIRRDESVKDKVKWIHGYITMGKTRRLRDTVGDLVLYKSKYVEKFETLRLCIPARNSKGDKNVMIGHKILVNEKSVEFEARCGKKRVGFKETVYEDDEN